MTTARRPRPGRRRTVALTGAAIAVTAIGGAGTHALWGRTTAVDAGTIAAGDLDTATIGALAWHSVADDEDPDVLGSGERAWAVQGFDLALDGRNLIADATVDVALTADLSYPYQWFVSSDPAIADPHAAVVAGSVPGLVIAPASTPRGTFEGLTESDLPRSLDGTADWFVYVLVDNPHPPQPGDPSDLDLLTVRADLTLEQTS